MFVDDTLQTWSPVGIWHSYDSYESDPTEEELLALDRADWIEDYKEQTLVRGSVLYVMTDDLATGGSESTSGEIDYIHITTG